MGLLDGKSRAVVERAIISPSVLCLAKSFFFAGAPSLLVSHWPVRDAVAARITVIASELANQDSALSPAQSLLMAMREIRNDNGHDTEDDTWAHPNAWAPFVIVGDR